MEIVGLITYRRHNVYIEHEGESFVVTMQENDFGWDIYVMNIDTACEIHSDNPLWKLLTDAADKHIHNIPDFDSAGFSKDNTTHHCDDLDCNCSI